MNVFQNEVCRLIQFSLSSEIFYKNIDNPGFKEIFVQYLRQYPGISSNGKNTWQKVDLYQKHHKITERASKIIENYKGNPQFLWKELHYEHIYPISLLKKRLISLGLNPEIKDIQSIMIQSEVIILSKEEANLLDGSPLNEYPIDGRFEYGKGFRSTGLPNERLKAINAKFDNKYLNNCLLLY